MWKDSSDSFLSPTPYHCWAYSTVTAQFFCVDFKPVPLKCNTEGIEGSAVRICGCEFFVGRLVSSFLTVRISTTQHRLTISTLVSVRCKAESVQIRRCAASVTA